MDERAMSPAVDGQETDSEHDFIEEIGRDLHEVQALLEQLSAIPGAVKAGSADQCRARRATVELIRAAQARHEARGMRYLWPTVRETLPNGDRLTEMAVESNRRVKDLLAALAKLPPEEAEFDDLVEQLTLACRMQVVFKDQVLVQLGEAGAAPIGSAR